MRLTLRTLLAYLDDTLEPHEIKEIGLKVAESDAAQELVARIKQVTRRRRLTTPPPDGPNAKCDANTIAEYLDNELSTEFVAELEKTCLESDVHLAEVASCHQILTLVLGEPALVPPTARERMYGLVKGREAIPFRKARSRDGAASEDGAERYVADPLMPDLPSSRGWLLWVLPLAAVLVLAVLAVAVWQALPPGDSPAVAAVTPAAGPPKDNGPPPAATTATPAPDGTASVAPPPPGATTPVGPPPAGTTPMTPPPAGTTPMTPPPAGTTTAPPDERPKPPSTERKSVGFYGLPNRGEASVLLQRQTDQPGWKRLKAGGTEVYGTDDLVSLPGYNSELTLGADGGVHLLLHGHVPQFTVHPFETMDFLLESAVQLHQPEVGLDADLTLKRGRIYLSNHRPKDPVKVRLRFGREIWDVTLKEPDTEIGVDLLQGYTGAENYRDGEAPLQNVYLFIFSGRASIKFDSHAYGDLPARTSILWDNKGTGAAEPRPTDPKVWPSVLSVWSKTPPVGATEQERKDIQSMRAALDSLSLLMTDKSGVDSTLGQALKDDEPMLRLLSIYSLGAIDAASRVLDVLCSDAAEAHDIDRRAAIFTLRRWLGRDPGNGLLLYDEKKETGLLVDRKYHSADARTILVLLHDIPAADVGQSATFEKLTSLLRSKELAIRELAYWTLVKLTPGMQLPPYNAAWGEGQRDEVVDAWKRLIADHKLPPPPAQPNAPPRDRQGDKETRRRGTD